MNPGKYFFWRIFSIIVMGALISGVIFTSFFIYSKIYFTIANIEVIATLSEHANLTVLDLPGYEKAQKLITLKTEKNKIPKDIRNIFFYANELNYDKATTTKSKK